MVEGISIHAPTWGATSSHYIKPQVSRISIHAPTWGATLVVIPSTVHLQFQSTHPRGVRLRWVVCRDCNRYFNPRTHVGCDVTSLRLRRGIRISIHAPTWGATWCVVRCLLCIQISIHAPTWGATRSRPILYLLKPISIHAPTWGATPVRREHQDRGEISIHAPTWGATVKPSNGWLLGHKDNEFANENIIIINSVNIT